MITTMRGRHCQVRTDEIGNLLRAPLHLEDEVPWSGHANVRLRDLVEPLLHQVLQTPGLLIRERLPGNVGCDIAGPAYRECEIL